MPSARSVSILVFEMKRAAIYARLKRMSDDVGLELVGEIERNHE
jgi:hypothetical protein